MELKDLVAISGKPGLYRMVSQGKNVLIVESLETGQRMPTHAANRISSLEEIAVFTDAEDKPLKEVLVSIFKKENGNSCLDPKKASPDELRSYFAEILPHYDRLKVYLSDICKILTWYNILIATGHDFTEPVSETKQEAGNPEPVE